MMFDGLSSAFSLVYYGIHYMFEVQAAFWDEFGVFPTFILVFVAAVFFRYIVLRMFGAAEAGASDSIVQKGKRQ